MAITDKPTLIEASMNDQGSSWPNFGTDRIAVRRIYNSNPGRDAAGDFIYEIQAFNGDAPSDHSSVADALPNGSRWYSVTTDQLALFFILSDDTWVDMQADEAP